MIYTFEFTDEHWAAHEAATITIPLERFEHLVTAVELLSEGRQLTAEQQHAWSLIVDSADAMLAIEYKKILKEVG